MNLELNDKAAIVTAASKGLGKATALAWLASTGYGNPGYKIGYL